MRLGAPMFVALLAGCAQLPSVSLKVRARFEHEVSRSARSLEARVDCGWSFERSAVRAAAIEPERVHLGELGAGSSFEPGQCALPSACSWEQQSRAAALAAVAYESPIATGAAR